MNYNLGPDSKIKLDLHNLKQDLEKNMKNNMTVDNLMHELNILDHDDINNDLMNELNNIHKNEDIDIRYLDLTDDQKLNNYNNLIELYEISSQYYLMNIKFSPEQITNIKFFLLFIKKTLYSHIHIMQDDVFINKCFSIINEINNWNNDPEIIKKICEEIINIIKFYESPI